MVLRMVLRPCFQCTNRKFHCGLCSHRQLDNSTSAAPNIHRSPTPHPGTRHRAHMRAHRGPALVCLLRSHTDRSAVPRSGSPNPKSVRQGDRAPLSCHPPAARGSSRPAPPRVHAAQLVLPPPHHSTWAALRRVPRAKYTAPAHDAALCPAHSTCPRQHSALPHPVSAHPEPTHPRPSRRRLRPSPAPTHG